jgi:hypothetical protein
MSANFNPTINNVNNTIVITDDNDSDDDDDDLIIVKEVKKARTGRSVPQTTQTLEDIEVVSVAPVVEAVGVTSNTKPGPSSSKERGAAVGKKQPSPEKPKKPELKCPICMEGFDIIAATNVKIMSTRCGHIFCEPCLKESLKPSNQKICPTCRAKLTNKTSYHQLYLS